MARPPGSMGAVAQSESNEQSVSETLLPAGAHPEAVVVGDELELRGAREGRSGGERELLREAQGDRPGRAGEGVPAAELEQLIARRPTLRLLSALDGNMGIQLARAHQPEVILMDINLPGISGIEALKILREDPATAHIPVIALSANAMPRDIEKGLEAGFLSYLTKPIKVLEFMGTLDAAFDFAKQNAVRGR